MKLDITSITRLNGHSLDVEFKENIDSLKTSVEDYEFGPVKFTGKIVNVNEVFKLGGLIFTEYRVKCYRCLEETVGTLNIDISENFVRSDTQHDEETYTYENNCIELEQALRDNIVLHLPTRVLCSKDCKGLCSKCGCNLNNNNCHCTENEINPQMEGLKDFFKE